MRIFHAAMTAIAIVSMAPALYAQSAPREAATHNGVREIVPLVGGWQFRFEGIDTPAAAAAATGEGWSTVSLPHSWNRLGGRSVHTPGDDVRRGKGWYKLVLRRDAPMGGKRAYLQFDGASIVADIWLNGVHLGRHEGAFQRFRFDATKALRQGDNVLVVRTDNSEPKHGSATHDIIPVTGDWFMFGGLYRTVSLVVTDPVHVEMLDHGSPGVFARTEAVDADKARIAVRSLLRNDRPAAVRVRVSTEIVDRDGRSVAVTHTNRRLPSAQTTVDEMHVDVARPRLWNGVADPYLYTVRVTVRDAAGRVLDIVEQPLGIRTIQLDAQRGFVLNGTVVPLHGVALHQDRMDRGWAMSPAEREQDFALMRELGANTIRLSHYQHDQQAYDLADRMGLVLWTEIPLVGRASPEGEADTTPAMKANAEVQLRELIRQNYNHPSVAVWGIGNEVNFDTAVRQQPGDARPLLNALQLLAKQEDSSRPTALADCCGTFPGEGLAGLRMGNDAVVSLAGVADALGVNRYFGWYSLTPDFLATDMERIRKAYPDKPLSISEFGAGAALTQHTDNPLGGPIASFSRPHPEGYQTWVHEQWWPQIARRNDLWAAWIWNMFDFASAARQEGDLVDTNDKGLVTYDRATRKDSFYYYKAQWNPAPMAHLTGARHAVRAYPFADIKAYSNADRLTLSVNGKAIGETQCPARICSWPAVPLAIGENRLTVSGVAGGQPVSDAMTLTRRAGAALYAIPAGVLTASGTSEQPVGSDAFFEGGKGNDTQVPNTPRGPFKPLAVIGGTRPELHKGWRSGTFRYLLPVPAGRRRVRLSFFESDAKMMPGQRVFDVTANGRKVLTALDVRAAAGAAAKVIEKTFEVNASGGKIELSFTPVRGEAMVTSIEIDPAR